MKDCRLNDRSHQMERALMRIPSYPVLAWDVYIETLAFLIQALTDRPNLYQYLGSKSVHLP